MIRNYLHFFFLALLLSFKIYAQAPSFKWAKSFAGVKSSNPIAIIADSIGNVCTSGDFNGTFDFDPSAGVANLTAIVTDIFISKLDSSGNYIWAKQIEGPDLHRLASMKMDRNGNLYLIGNFRGVTDFDPGPGTYTMAASSSTAINVFILKLDANGNFIWAKQLEISPIITPEGLDITTDNIGNVYCSGEFNSTRDLDPGPGVFNLTANMGQNSNFNVFVLKLDPNGNFVWVKQLDAWRIRGIETDASGNVYAAGAFRGVCDFDPGPGTYTLAAGGNPSNAFILKLSGNGNFIWAKQLMGPDYVFIDYFKMDCQENMYFILEFKISFDADTGPAVTTFTSNGSGNLGFLLKLNSAGNFIWGNPLENIGSNNFAVDFSQNIYLTGSFKNTVDFDLGPGTYTLASAPGVGDIFIAKYLINGNFAWAYNMPTNSNFWGYGTNVCADRFDKIHYTGVFAGTVDFDPFQTVSNLTSTLFYTYDVFVQKFSQQGTNIPVITSSSNSIRLCGSQSATLNAIGGYSVNWYSTASSTLSLGSGSPYITPTLTSTTTYYVASSGCGFIGTRTPVTVTIYPLPTVLASSSNSLICLGKTATLTASGATSYQWETSANYSIIVSPSVNSTYTVVGTDLNGCNNSATISVLSNSKIPTTNFEYTPICKNSTDKISPNLSTSFDPTGVFYSNELELNPSSGEIDVTTLNPGTYFVTYSTMVNACVGVSQASVVILPILSLSLIPTINITQGSSTTLTVSGGNSYNWSPSVNLSCFTCSNPIANSSENTQYCVTSELNNCQSKVCVNVNVLCESDNDFSLPNAFTPNGDGYNDQFCLQGWDICVKNFSILIFDRWGEKVYESNNPSFCWDGVFKGKALETDVFVYRVSASFTNGSQLDKKGNITLIR